MPSADLVLPARMSRVAVVSPQDAHARPPWSSSRRPAASSWSAACRPPRGRKSRRCGGSHRLNGDDGAPPVLARPPDGCGRARAGGGGGTARRRGRAQATRPPRASTTAASRRGSAGRRRTQLEPLNERLAEVGAAVVELPRPPWVEPPTLLQPVAVERPFRPLVQTYGTARYRDVDPTPFTVISFIVMFGMMFGDVGHGLVLVALALWLRRGGRASRAAPAPLGDPVRRGARGSVSSACSTARRSARRSLVPTLWLDPIERAGAAAARRRSRSGRCCCRQLPARDREPLARERPCGGAPRPVGVAGLDGLRRRAALRRRRSTGTCAALEVVGGVVAVGRRRAARAGARARGGRGRRRA